VGLLMGTGFEKWGKRARGKKRGKIKSGVGRSARSLGARDTRERDAFEVERFLEVREAVNMKGGNQGSLLNRIGGICKGVA